MAKKLTSQHRSIGIAWIGTAFIAIVALSLSACTGLKDAREACSDDFRPIYEVQGSTAFSPLAGERVTVRGIVVGDFQARDQLGGFFLQDPQLDDDPRTSQGLFVHAPEAEDIATGQQVQISGRVEETDGLTQLTDVEALTVCQPDPTPAPIAGTEISSADVGNLEPYEGMLVTLPGDWTVAGNRELGQKGQLMLAAGGRPFKRDWKARAAREWRLLLDDGRRIEELEEPPYLNATDTRRAGDKVSGLVGIISQQGDDHVLHPTAAPRFQSSNLRPTLPGVDGSVRVASFNLLNFFTTVGPRGASNDQELERQRAKLVAALSSLKADLVGLSELENNGEVAIRDLVDALNADPESGGDGRWAHVPDPPGGLGDDAIRVGLIYRPAAIQLVGPPIADRDPIFKRPPFAQTFEADGERFTVVVNHLKSKSCRKAEGQELDAGDGQGCWNPRRIQQTQQLLRFVARLQAASDDADVLVIGDLNAYGDEDPIRTLTDGGLVDLAAVHVPAAERYSYVYDGETGYLDHALATPDLADRVTGVAFWHINADEPSFLDYRASDSYYQPGPVRSSDHDPMLIGLNF